MCVGQSELVIFGRQAQSGPLTVAASREEAAPACRRGAVGGARTCASCNVVSGRAWVLLMDAEALSVCGEELGELRHYGAGLRGTAVAPTGCMLLRL